MLSLSRARYSNHITHNEEEGARHPQRRSGNEHSRSIWNVAEFTVASWTTGCSRNASSGKRTTRATARPRKTNEIDSKTIVVAILFRDLLRRHAGKGPIKENGSGVEPPKPLYLS